MCFYIFVGTLFLKGKNTIVLYDIVQDPTDFKESFEVDVRTRIRVRF